MTTTENRPAPNGNETAHTQNNLTYPDPFEDSVATPELLAQIKSNRRMHFAMNVANPFEALQWAQKHGGDVTVTMNNGAVHKGYVLRKEGVLNVLMSADGATVFDWLQINSVEVQF